MVCGWFASKDLGIIGLMNRVLVMPKNFGFLWGCCALVWGKKSKCVVCVAKTYGLELCIAVTVTVDIAGDELCVIIKKNMKAVD